MKKITILLASLFLIAGCTDSGGGVTSDPTPPTTNPPVVVPPTPVFNTVLSQLTVKDSANQIIYDNGLVAQAYKVELTARDQNGNLMSGLSVKLGLRDISGLTDITATESSTGKYTINFNSDLQGFFTAYLKLSGAEVPSMDYNFLVSFCNAPVQPSAAPFHSLVTYQSQSYYVICSAADLIALGQTPNLDKHALLGKTIDLETFYSDANSDSIPDNQFKIGSEANPFVGELNGSGFVIDKFKYLSSAENNVGLFAVLGDGALIKNLYFNNAQLKGASHVGSIAGHIINNGSVSAMIDNVSSSFNSVQGNSGIGGLVGTIESSSGKTIVSNIDSFVNQNLNLVSGNITRVGGVIGHNNGGSLNNISAQQVLSYTGNNSLTKVGGIIGENSNTMGSSVQNLRIYALQTYTKADSIGCLAGEANSSTISMVGQGTVCYIDQSSATVIPYSGGLFGVISDSTISNISASIDAQGVTSTFGGLAGAVYSSDISRIQLTGNIYASGSNIGGLIGVAVDSTIASTLSYVSINNSGSTNTVGGIIGNAQNVIMNKSSTQASINAPNMSIVGGLIGNVVGTLQLTNSYNNALIAGSTIVGGIIGMSDDDSVKTISSVYSSGGITGSNTVGGLIGYIDGNNTTIQNSFSLSYIQTSSGSVPSSSGAIIGTKMGTGVVSNNYFLSDSTNVAVGCGNGCSATNTSTGAGYTTDILYYTNPANAPFDTWDLTNTWVVTQPYLPYFQ